MEKCRFQRIEKLRWDVDDVVAGMLRQEMTQ